MSGPDYTGIALVVTPVMAGVVALVTLLVNNRSVKRVERGVEQVGATTDETLRQTTQVNHAVNGKDPRESTMSEDIIKIRDKQEVDQPTEKAPVNGQAVLPLLASLTEAVAEMRAELAALRPKDA